MMSNTPVYKPLSPSVGLYKQVLHACPIVRGAVFNRIKIDSRVGVTFLFWEQGRNLGRPRDSLPAHQRARMLLALPVGV